MRVAGCPEPKVPHLGAQTSLERFVRPRRVLRVVKIDQTKPLARSSSRKACMCQTAVCPVVWGPAGGIRSRR